ncbi:MAG TPA: outer membrane beta-barrel family protein, partial [Bacteroidia bacterium]|nr:outer membrane beta-barrel family protein [Bacteroidia bacterium]
APTLLTMSLPINGTVWAAQADYSNPIGKNDKIDFGLKGSIVSNDNNDQYWNVINGISYVDTTKSNRFLYKENIYAGYFNYYHKFSEKWEVQLGLRGEQTQINGTQYVHDTTFTRSYFNLFPSAFVTWKLNDNNSFNFSYSRRIDRPDYEELNPFIHFVDPYTYYTGNINLLPQYVDNFEIKYTYKTWLNAGLRYSYYSNIEVPVYTQIDSSHITYRKLDNIGFFNEGDFLVAVTIPVTSWFTTITSSDLYYNGYNGVVQGGAYTNNGYIWQPMTINTFRFKKGWSADVTFRYSSRNLNGPSVTEPFYVVEAGIRKQFGGGRATVSLNCSDIFWTNRQKTIYDFNGVNNTEIDYWDSRRIRITLSWKLGKSQYQREEKKKAAAEELNRVKTGN